MLKNPTIKKQNGKTYLDNKGTKNYTAKDRVVKNALKNISFSVDLAGVDLVEELHHYKGIKNYCVVFRRWGVEWCVPAAVDVKQPLPCRKTNDGQSFIKHNIHKKNINAIKRNVQYKKNNIFRYIKSFLPAKSSVKVMISWYTPCPRMFFIMVRDIRGLLRP